MLIIVVVEGVSQRWVIHARRMRLRTVMIASVIEERVDHLLAAFVAALEPVERVVPAERLEPDAISVNSVRL